MDPRRDARRALLWAGLTCLISAAVGLVSYLAGTVSGPEQSARASRPAPTAPSGATGLLPLADLYASGRQEGVLAARDRSYAAGRRSGLEEGKRAAFRKLQTDYRPGGREWKRLMRQAAREAANAGLGPFPGQGFYLVGVGPGGREIRDRLGPLQPGQLYGLCQGGKLCSQRAGGSGRRVSYRPGG